MSKIPPCPVELPPELRAPLRQFADAWAHSSARPRLVPEVARQWDELISRWSEDDNLPLYVRKFSNNRGSLLVHATGRALVPADNSPALWAYTLAYAGVRPNLAWVRAAVEEDRVPVAFALKTAERPGARFRRTLGQFSYLNQAGWKLAHIRGVGLNSSISLEITSLDVLKQHFRRFLSPSNMFLVPKAWAGLGELAEMIEAVQDLAR